LIVRPVKGPEIQEQIIVPGLDFAGPCEQGNRLCTGLRTSEVHPPIDQGLERAVQSLHPELEFGAQPPGLEFEGNVTTGFPIDGEALVVFFHAGIFEGDASIELPGFKALSSPREHRCNAKGDLGIARILNQNSSVEAHGFPFLALAASSVRLRE
jgi:hypothetical protein